MRLVLLTLLSCSALAMDKCGYTEADYVGQNFKCVLQNHVYKDINHNIECVKGQDYIVSRPIGMFCESIIDLHKTYGVPLPEGESDE